MSYRKVLTASMIFMSWILLFSADTTFAETTYTSTSVTYQCGGSDTQPIIRVTLYKSSPWTVEQSYTGTTDTPVCKNGQYIYFSGLTPNTDYQISETHQIPGCGWGECNPTYWYIFKTLCQTQWWYKDYDGDGYWAGGANYLLQCSRPAGYKLWTELIEPGTKIDCNDSQSWLTPADHDGDGYSTCTGDCDDFNAQRSPVDHDGDGYPSCGDCDDSNPLITTALVWYKDADNDGYTDGATLTQCTQPSGYKSASELYSTTILDCNDANPAINLPSTWYKDADNDGYTDGTTQQNCNQPTGYVQSATHGDCDDGDISIHPGTLEICDSRDNNCNGQVDEGFDKTWYKDYDYDKYTDGVTMSQCTQPIGYRPASELYSMFDCNDGDSSITWPCGGNDDDKRKRCFESTSDVATGELAHDQELFSAKGSSLPVNVTLTYKSLDSSNGPLGPGWRHSYDTYLSFSTQNVVFREGRGNRRYVVIFDGVYAAPDGEHSTLVRNADWTYTITEKDGLRYNFGQNGKITSIIDRNGKIMTFSYTSGNLTTVTNPAGHTATFTYDANNKITGITDPKGNSYTFAYTGGRLTSVTNPDGGIWRYTYDASGYMLTKANPNDKTVTYVYDSSHRILSATDPEEKTRSLTYPTGSASSQSTTFSEKDGGNWIYTYNTTTGYVTSKTDPMGNTTSYTYDTKGNMHTKTEPGNITTSYTYDTSGNMLTVTNPLSQTTTYTYNSRGQVLTATDDRGTITNTYDTNGNLTSVTDLSGATTTYVYDTSGRVTSITNALNQATTFAYDATTGNLTSTIDITGATTTFTYDANGNMITQSNSSGTTTFEYDGMNRLTKATDPQGHETTNTYDKMGNLITIKDANNNTTTYEYNYKGQVTKVTDALNNQTIYNYSGTGCSSCGGGVDKLTSITDAKNQKTSYQYDLLGRLTKETDPLNKMIIYWYDEIGNLVAKDDGKFTVYAYDALNRLTSKIDYDTYFIESYSYDTKGNLTSVANDNITYYMTYDNAGRITEINDIRGSTFYTISYEYNALGQKTKATYPGGKVVNYTYDSGSRPQNITSAAGTFLYSYDAIGRRTKTTYPNGTEADYAYDAVGRLTSLVNKITGGADITAANYTYDNVGNRLSKTGTTTENYQYDSIYRLTSAAKTKESESYTYDAVGNRLTGPGAIDTDYAYNAANQMTAGRKLNYTYNDWYDSKGNQATRSIPNATDKTWIQTWDYENRLIKLEKVKGTERKTVTFKYDPFGRRIEKKVVTVKGGVTKTQTYSYVYDNEDIIQETLTTDTTTEVTRYTHGPGIDEPLAMERNGQFYYYHADGLGCITAITDSTKTVKQSYTYDSFGMPKPSTSFRNAYTFTSREWDSETGLYFYRARYYDPMAGRFLSRDPLSFDGDATNLYEYSRNNPLRYTDPLGLLSYDQVKSLVGSNNLSGQSNELIICTCWKESGFNPNAQSGSSSARGLMQVTKAAAKDAGYSYDQLFDGATNIKAGSKYLKIRIQWAGGNVTSGLNGYGTGAGYATNILQCEKCLKETPCEYQKCLNMIHP